MISHRWFRRLGGLVVSFILLLSAGSLVPGAEDADRKVVPDCTWSDDLGQRA